MKRIVYKIINLLALIVILFNLSDVLVFAIDNDIITNPNFNITLNVLNQTVEAGNEFDVFVNIENLVNDADEVIVIGGELIYDTNILEIVSMEEDEAWNKVLFNDNNFKFITDNKDIVTEEGTVFKVKFRVKDEITAETKTSISLKNVEVGNGILIVKPEDSNLELTIMPENKTFTTSLKIMNQNDVLTIGEEFDVSVNIEDLENVEGGVIVLGGELVYDANVLEIVDMEEENAWSKAFFNENNFKFITDNEGMVTEDGIVFKTRFRVKDTITEETKTSISLKNVEAGNGISIIKTKDTNLELTIVPENDIFITSETYLIADDEKVISKILPGITLKDFTENVETNGSLVISDKDGNIISEDDSIGTEMKLNVGNDLEFTLIVTGDIDGDCRISINDLAKLKLYYVKKESLADTQLKAADVSPDNKITIDDVSIIKLMLSDLK